MKTSKEQRYFEAYKAGKSPKECARAAVPAVAIDSERFKYWETRASRENPILRGMIADHDAAIAAHEQPAEFNPDPATPKKRGRPKKQPPPPEDEMAPADTE